ncbi:MAG: hypothetical protein AB1473_12480 [Thermodesulfobacteriota bacterium]
MTRFALLLGALCMVLAPCLGSAQVAPPLGPGVPPAGPGYPGTPLYSPFQGPGAQPYLQRSPDEAWTVRSEGRAGHMWLTYNISFPFQIADFIGNPFFVGMDLSLKDTNYWMGIYILELQPIQDFIVYGRLGGNIPKDSTAILDYTGAGNRIINSVPIGAGAQTVSPWTWTAPQVFWWMVEGGVAWMFTRDFGLDLGFRAEHVDFSLTSPRNGTLSFNNNPPTFAIPCDRI